MSTKAKSTRARAVKAAVEAIRAVEAEPATVEAPPAVPAILRTTPALANGKGPDPVAIREGRIAPKREGYVLAAILNGDGGGTFDGVLSFLSENSPSDYKGKVRKPTVDYFLRAAVEAGIIEKVKVAGRDVYLPLSDSPFSFARATESGLAFRSKVLGFLAPAAPEVSSPAATDGDGSASLSTPKGNRKTRRAARAAR